MYGHESCTAKHDANPYAHPRRCAAADRARRVGASWPSLPESKKDRFDALDLDGDGKLSLAEAAGHEQIVVHFDKADRNRDGRLTQAEFDNLGKPVPKRRAKATGRTDRAPKGSAGTRSASMP